MIINKINLLVRSIGKKLPDFNIPFGLTIKHYYPFSKEVPLTNNELNSSQSWNVLRNDHPSFILEKNREKWLKQCELGKNKDGQDGYLSEKAEAIVAILKKNKITSLYSMGVGEACLEYQIKKKYPELNLFVSEYIDSNVETLKQVFKESQGVFKFDMLKDDWSRFGNDNGVCVLLFRIDANFTDDEHRKIFEKIYQARIMNLIYVPGLFLTVKFFIFEKLRFYLCKLLHKRIVFAGYFHTLLTSRKFWQCLYSEEKLNLCGKASIKHGASRGFFLTRIAD